MKNRKLDKKIEKTIVRVLHEQFAEILADVDFRIKQAYVVAGRAETGGNRKVYAEDLNLLGRHLLTGYAVNNNTPVAGSISWTNLHIVYNGVDNVITDGNTALAYAWWSPSVTPTVLQSSNTKPTLAAGEVLLFTNSGGVNKVMLSDTNSSLPTVVANGSVDNSAILANAVDTLQIAPSAVGATQLGANAVTSTKILDGAIIGGKIAANGINLSTQFAANVVNNAAIGPLAVTGAELAAGAVVAGKIAAGGLSASNQIASGMVDATAIGTGAVTNTKLGALAVDGTKIAALAVDGTKITSGAVSAAKLSILRHILY